MKRYFQIIVLIFLAGSLKLTAQPDNDSPLSPVLELVTVQPETGRTIMYWTSSTSPDVKGYILYNLRNGEGFAFDTIWDASATSAMAPGTAAMFRQESYVIAAIDSSGNLSPLSNELKTVFASLLLDSCNKKIIVNWTPYTGVPHEVTGYRVKVSGNGSPYIIAGNTGPEISSFAIDDFIVNSNYCIIIEVLLAGGKVSSSNKSCINTSMQQPPAWINADYATVEDGQVMLQFSIDPLSEIQKYRIERKSGVETGFTVIAERSAFDNQVVYTDLAADTAKVNHYRLVAINNCNNAIAFSNEACNIVPALTVENDLLKLKWSAYRKWQGDLDRYGVFVDKGNGYVEAGSINGNDTSYIINYRDIMYQISGHDLCFRITAFESGNPHGLNATSNSTRVCTGLIENITLPNAFTPDRDLVNDKFGPTLSFTPVGYRLVITDRLNKVVFDSTDFLEKWDGTAGGKILPSDVYIYFLQLTTPSGKIVRKTGTVTILR
ncbi:MAG: gliding motility-associated C-terminal domain-containing protein [Bacteroidales bacterium]